jgi:DNA-binding transcriptional regulator LsrR (DeoR family)
MKMPDMTFDELMEECGAAARWEAKGLEKAAKKLWKHGMDPAEIAEALELPPDTVSRYLGAGRPAG